MELLIAVGGFGLISGVVYFVFASRVPVSVQFLCICFGFDCSRRIVSNTWNCGKIF